MYMYTHIDIYPIGFSEILRYVYSRNFVPLLINLVFTCTLSKMMNEECPINRYATTIQIILQPLSEKLKQNGKTTMYQSLQLFVLFIALFFKVYSIIFLQGIVLWPSKNTEHVC